MTILALSIVVALLAIVRIDGHAHLMIPMSRNYYAAVNGSWYCPTCDQNTTPKPEDCPFCMNNQNGHNFSTCGIKQDGNIDYNYPLSMNGNILPWKSQAVYVSGSIINVTVGVSTYHNGYIQLSACPRSPNPPTQDCFDKNPLMFIADVRDGAVKDVNYPNRAYLSPNPKVTNKWNEYQFLMQLPTVASGDFLIQWMYITANSCNPPGYGQYPFPWTGSYQPGMLPCSSPGSSSWIGERFWNCAEVTITGGKPTTPYPTSKPSTKKPSKKPTKAPVKPSKKPTKKPSIKPTKNCCTGSKTGFVATNGCTDFVICVKGRSYGIVSCPPGTLFSKNGYCDVSQSVTCSGSC